MIKNLIILALITVNGVFGWALYQAMQSTQPPAQVANTAPIGTIQQNQFRTDQSQANTNTETEPASKTVIQSSGPQLDQDYHSLINELRLSGLDEALLRQIMLATINRDHLLLEANGIKEPYWKAVDKDPEEKLTHELSWEADRRQQLLSLFGAEIIDDPLFEELFKPLNDRLPFLNSDKQIQLHNLQRRDEAMSQNLFAGGYTQESRDDLRLQRQDLQRQISELLGTADTFEYQLRESRLAGRMRQGLGDFDYSEQEFREIFTIRQENEGVDFNRFSNRSEFRSQREESESRIQDYLGSSRYEAYARSQDPAYRSLQSIGERYGNSTAEINEVYTISQETNDQITNLRNSSSLSRADRQERMEEIRQESFEKIQQIAGKETAESIKENSRRLGFNRRIRPGG
tara:strand:+ start:1151 stop:2359 length:1209 start_codon:yes stop_codon:yes gene_type:complete